jgi:membrane protease YdiL (CAAX protease family)
MFKNKIFRYAFIYGSIAALICIAVALIQYYGIEKSPFGRYKLPAFGINIIFIIVATWVYRANNLGVLSFTEGFSIGFITNLVAAIITGLLFFIFVQFVDKPYGNNQAILLWVQENIKGIEKIKDVHIKNFGNQEYNLLLKQAQEIPTAGYVLLDEIAKKQLCIVGITIISVIFRRHTFRIS